jgi:hypothetical protein
VARKRFCSIVSKELQGEIAGEKLIIHLDTRRRLEVIAFASSMFQALAHGKGIRITVTQKGVKKGFARLTVTSHT